MVDVTDALIQALVRRGVKTVYGVPGDFVLGLFKRFEDCKEIETVCTAGEEGAAFAADAQARLNGLGVVMITYGVGALKVCVWSAKLCSTSFLLCSNVCNYLRYLMPSAGLTLNVPQFLSLAGHRGSIVI